LDAAAKLHILADAAKYDTSCATSGSVRKRSEGGIGNAAPSGICHSFTPDGRCVALLKILLTNYCIYDCAYCVNRISSDTPRARFEVREIVELTLDFYKRNYIEGLFLSSGIIQSPDYTMEQLVAVARSLRVEHSYCGYIHLKSIAGASPELLREAGRYADRLSVNIELPTQPDLDRLAPAKNQTVIERSMTQIRRAGEETATFAPAGQTTQMVVGATPSTDSEILAKADSLYRDHHLKRVYYSAYSPIPHPCPVLPLKPPPLVRESRLYQADWLMRFYGFRADELTTPEAANLPLNQDPKLAWALRHRDFFPIDINSGSREALLRVPGLGVKNVKRILRIRRYHRLRVEDLAKLRVPTERARQFLVCDGGGFVDPDRVLVRPPVPMQFLLFEAAASARTGEL
jgi:putative DNA modification/repair radical SAM protein